MVVQHNLRAMNSNRMLGLTASVQSKSTEKLSSGYKINRAADDAAGLSISEKMRKQIRGLSQASLNASDGISAVQTAEGALNEVQDMLQRMNELAVKASNGTMSEDDRSYIQNEIEQLETEINRVAETTKFNETYMLKGGNGTKTEYLNAHDAGIKGELVETGKGKALFTMDALKAGDSITIAGKDYTIAKETQTDAVADEDYTFTAKKGASFTIDLSTWNDVQDKIAFDSEGDNSNDGLVVKGDVSVDADAIIAALTANNVFKENYTVTKGEEDTLIISANDSSVSLDDLKAEFVVTKDNTALTADDLEGTENVENSSLEVAEGVKLYAANGTKELTEEEAIEELEAGNKLYVDEGVSFEQTEAKADVDYKVNPAYTSVTFDTTGWAAATDTITIAGVTTAAASLEDAVAELNGKETFSKKYEASINEDGNLVIKSYDEKVTAADIKADITAATVGSNNKTGAALTALITENDPVEESVTIPKGNLYAAGGTEALTEEEILEAVKKGEKLFTNSAKREDSELTVKEAYTKIQEELLKANQIGDTLGSAKVEEAGIEEKTAADFKAADVQTIGGTEYSVADKTMDEFLAVIDEIEKTAEAGPDTTAITISFENAAGKQEFTITPDTNAGTASAIQQTKTDGAATTATIADLGKLKEALKAGAGLEITIAGGAAANKTDAFAGSFTVAGDDVEGATVISAAKMAELVNENAQAEADAGPTKSFEITTGSAEVAKTLTFNLHVGADADMTNKINVSFEAMTAEYLGVAGLNVSDDTGLGATYAVDAILDAIQKVSTQRSALGAVQNRLEHTIANLDNVVENTTAAESQIRDTDMATEMVKYSNNNILAQAGQAMLAQANQANQGVLSLLG